MRLVFVHVVDNNFGDANCCPKQLRPEWAGCPEYDFRDYQANSQRDDMVVMGGGGMLYPRIDAWIQRLTKSHPVYLWGVGVNYHSMVVPDLKGFLERCIRVTLRHRGDTGFEYSPCPSLGRAEFLEYMAAPVAPSADMVFYSHKSSIISEQSGIKGVPELTNNRERLQDAGKDDLLSVLRFLGSGRVVVTNSYHGVLWGQALDRPVVVWRPDSTRHVYQQPFLREPDAVVQEAGEVSQAVARLVELPLPAAGHQGFPLLREARERVLKEAKTLLRILPFIRFA